MNNPKAVNNPFFQILDEMLNRLNTSITIQWSVDLELVVVDPSVDPTFITFHFWPSRISAFFFQRIASLLSSI